MKGEWSWDQNPMNLTCIATAIPNATLTWWYEDREIGREIIDRNYEVCLDKMFSEVNSKIQNSKHEQGNDGFKGKLVKYVLEVYRK